MVRRDPAAAERELEEVGSLEQRSLAEVREAVVGYRRVSLAGELESARSALAAARFEASVRTEGALSDEVGSVIAWTIREGVTNVIRHSGARHCEILVHAAGSAAMVEITDDGSGLPSSLLLGTDSSSGFGLRGLADRMRAAGVVWRRAAAAAGSGWRRLSRPGDVRAGPGDQDLAGGGSGDGAGRPGDPPGAGRPP
jgi:two-component system sensor histidine kinase DesK